MGDAGAALDDLVELAPVSGLHACDYTAAALVYKIMSYALSGTAPRHD